LKKPHLKACEGKENKIANAKLPVGAPNKWSVEPFLLYSAPHLPDALGTPQEP